VIALAFIEKVAEAAALEVMGSMAHAQVQERGGDDVAAHEAAFARHNGRSIEGEDRKSNDGDKPIDTIGEGLNNPKVAEDVIALAFIEKVAEAAALEVMGSMAHAQVQERGGDDVAAHAAAFARRNGRSIESEDRKSNDAENRFIDLVYKAVSNAACDTFLSWMC